MRVRSAVQVSYHISTKRNSHGTYYSIVRDHVTTPDDDDGMQKNHHKSKPISTKKYDTSLPLANLPGLSFFSWKPRQHPKVNTCLYLVEARDDTVELILG